MSKKQDIQEKLEVGGGATGTSFVPDPVGGKATLPNSKQQGDGMQKLKDVTPGQGTDECDTETNTKPTGDMSAQNKASVSMKEDIEAMFNGEELTEEFKEKATVIFEAAVNAKVQEIVSQMDEEYAQKFEDAKNEIYEEVTAKVDSYMDYVVEQWMKENEVAIESSLRSDITESFIEGMKTLFAEHYIDVPEEKFDVLEDLAAKVEELENTLNQAISENVELKSQLSETAKDQILAKVAEGLSVTQAEKFKTLAEGVEYDDAGNYERKLEIVKENYFPQEKKVVTALDQEEAVSLSEEAEYKRPAGPVANYVEAISRTIKR